MKIAFIYGRRASSVLTKLFTGSACYHVGFTDGKKFWDMNLIRRRRDWPHYDKKNVLLVECPVEISAEYLDGKLDTDEEKYGFADYLFFALRPIYHFFGHSTRNAGGVICSEMVEADLLANGWQSPFKEVPSPADLELVFFGRKNAWQSQA